jgi:glyoxylase-like metal-dependent hydrolase (beta-lactamase superfamily II)
MVFGGSGQVARGLYVCGIPWSPVYLLDGKQPLLFEAGYTCTWRIAEQMIRSVLVDREPEILFLTHVHWDHCGTAGHLRRVFPRLRVAASARAAEIMKRPNAIRLMTELSTQVTPNVALVDGMDASRLSNEPFLPFDVDLIVEDGQTIEFGTDVAVRVLATSGHTRDHVSYYIPERKILIATEACGCLDRAGQIITEFLVDYDAYLASLERLAALPVEILCQGHHFVFVGVRDVKDFFARSIREAKAFKERVYELLDAEGGAVERVVARIKAEQYDANPHVKQLEQAYLLNVRTQVAHLASRKTVNGDQ